jgi:hypothetical protein
MSDNIFKKIADKITDYAPAIAGVLAGTGVGAPAGAALVALGTLGKAFGLGSKAEPEEILSVVSVDPEIKLKAMMAESNFKLESKRIDLEKYKAALADVQNARNNATEQVKATGKRDANLYVLAWVIVGGFIGLIATMLTLQFVTGKTVQSDPMLMLLVGSLSTDAGMVVGYFFGSSQSSAKKDLVIAEAIQK